MAVLEEGWETDRFPIEGGTIVCPRVIEQKPSKKAKHDNRNIWRNWILSELDTTQKNAFPKTRGDMRKQDRTLSSKRQK